MRFPSRAAAYTTLPIPAVWALTVEKIITTACLTVMALRKDLVGGGSAPPSENRFQLRVYGYKARVNRLANERG